MKPIIGIIVCGLMDHKQYVSNAYIQAIKRCGGLPLVIPAVKSNEALGLYSQLCDGFLFCGGGDITPLLFKEEPQSGLLETNITLDVFQIRLMKQVLQVNKPVLAICRGLQVLNVACGGTLYQDIENQPGNNINHMQASLSRRDVSHKVCATSGSRLQHIIGDFAYTNSFHHQAVAKVGDGLIITGKTSDDTIEALEMPNHSFVLGVQWHPECMYQTTPQMKDIFLSFLLKCRAS
ncbi:MAG: gamma-glutamyl-gamma-aminobutyrate hydrolase family protein [Lachnospiraceae bacterium]